MASNLIDTERLPALRSRIRGCLLGGAIGDALGAPVEFLSLEEIHAQFGPFGIREFAAAYGRLGAITDDTQMTLFTAEGLLRASVRGRLKGIVNVTSAVCHAYVRWLLTQDVAPAMEPDNISRNGWLWAVQDLHARRAPGLTCLESLKKRTRCGDSRAENDSKGAGAIMRIAPIARLVDGDDAGAARRIFECAKTCAWITHGHPSGYLSAAAFAVILHALLWGHSIEEGVDRAVPILELDPDSKETVSAIRQALSLVEQGIVGREAIARLGAGWVGEEALAIALYCALTERDFERAVCLAVNHGGDSDTTGLLVGQLIGAQVGVEALPARWLEQLELRQTIETIADDLTDFPDWDVETKVVNERYPGG